jgi:decaprenylphospho-beta-D-ribofuranose 2-oxidase
MIDKIDFRAIKSFNGTVIDKCILLSEKEFISSKLSKSKNKKIIYGGSLNSYVPCAYGNNVVTVLGKNTFIHPINENDKTITVGADIKIYELFNFLKENNYLLKVMPGYSSATIGACVATNVHGKNQFKDGNFSKYICEIKLKSLNNKIQYISSTKNKNLFKLTIGGFGVTGQIISVKLFVEKLKSHYFLQKTCKFIIDKNFIKIFRKYSQKSQYVYTIHNTSKNKLFGNGLFIHGNFLKNIKNENFPKVKNIFFYKNIFNFSLFNRFTSLLFNKFLLFKFHKSNNQKILINDIYFPINKNKLYYSFFSNKGFYEYQVIIPYNNFINFFNNFKKIYFTSAVTITLLTSKLFKGKKSFLNFNGSGICLTINLNKNIDSYLFLSKIDALCIKYGCIVNIIKDSRINRSTIAALYGKEYDSFVISIKPFLKRFNSYLLQKLL